MENTCRGEECPLWKKYKEKCPNFIESWWTPKRPGDDGQPYLIKDCAPRRTFLMIQELHNRLIGVEKSNEQQRNANIVTIKVLSDMIRSNAEVIGNQQVLSLPLDVIDVSKEETNITGD